jgi:type IV secretory pathway VirB10-like protein
MSYDPVTSYKTTQVRTMFAPYSQSRSSARRVVFGAAMFIAVLAFVIGSETAKAQVQFGIGGGGIGGGIGILLNDSFRRHEGQEYQQKQRAVEREKTSTRETRKAKNQRAKRENTKVAKESQAKESQAKESQAKESQAKESRPAEKSPEPSANAPSPKADNFGD